MNSKNGESPGVALAKPTPRSIQFGEFERALTGASSRIQEMEGGPIGKLLGAELKRRLGNVRVLSLDVFDTLLLRNNSPEAERFFVLSERLEKAITSKFKQKVSAEDLFLTRRRAMEFCYRTSKSAEGCVEGRIEDVVENQARTLGLKSGAAKLMLDEELLFEQASLRTNKALIAVARSFAAAGGMVILISDMYLGAQMISSLLKKMVGDISFVSKIYSSADVILNKRSGRIFPWVATQLQVAPSQVLHVGDSIVSDYQKPVEAGWQAMHFPISKHEQSERHKALSAFAQKMFSSGVDVSWAKA